jgi:ankyrin repeat protein
MHHNEQDSKYEGTIELLLERGADVPALCFDAACSESGESTPLVLACTMLQQPPLIAALERRHLAVAKLLVQNGADANVRHGEHPALWPAIRYCHTAEVALLLQADADANAVYSVRDDKSVLRVALELGKLRAAEMLLQRGADIGAVEHSSRGAEKHSHAAATLLIEQKVLM